MVWIILLTTSQGGAHMNRYTSTRCKTRIKSSVSASRGLARSWPEWLTHLALNVRIKNTMKQISSSSSDISRTGVRRIVRKEDGLLSPLRVVLKGANGDIPVIPSCIRSHSWRDVRWGWPTIHGMRYSRNGMKSTRRSFEQRKSQPHSGIQVSWQWLPIHCTDVTIIQRLRMCMDLTCFFVLHSAFSFPICNIWNIQQRGCAWR